MSNTLTQFYTDNLTPQERKAKAYEKSMVDFNAKMSDMFANIKNTVKGKTQESVTFTNFKKHETRNQLTFCKRRKALSDSVHPMDRLMAARNEEDILGFVALCYARVGADASNENYTNGKNHTYNTSAYNNNKRKISVVGIKYNVKKPTIETIIDYRDYYQRNPKHAQMHRELLIMEDWQMSLMLENAKSLFEADGATDMVDYFDVLEIRKKMLRKKDTPVAKVKAKKTVKRLTPAQEKAESRVIRTLQYISSNTRSGSRYSFLRELLTDGSNLCTAITLRLNLCVDTLKKELAKLHPIEDARLAKLERQKQGAEVRRKVAIAMVNLRMDQDELIQYLYENPSEQDRWEVYLE